MMDRRTLLAFALIGLVFILSQVFFSPSPPPPSAQKGTPQATTQTPGAPQQGAPQGGTPQGAPQGGTQTGTATPPGVTVPQLPARYDGYTKGDAHYVTIETPLYKATLNTRGGLLARMELKRYKSWYLAPVQLICDSAGFPGVLSLGFTAADGSRISTEQMIYTVDGPPSATLGANDSVVVTARLVVPGRMDAAAPADTSTATTGARKGRHAGKGTAPAAVGHDSTAPSAPHGIVIEKRFVFHGSGYGIGFDVAIQDSSHELAATNPTYDITWRNGLKYQEHNSVDESAKARTLVMTTEDRHEVNATEVGTVKEEKVIGTLEWVGTSVKYFGAALIPQTPLPRVSTVVDGTLLSADSSGHVEVYNFAVTAPIANNAVHQHFTLFVGPLEYDAVHALGIAKLLDLGGAWIRPISEYLLLPLFNFLHGFIGNWGIVIIVFSLIIRAVLWPLSIPQIKSSRKMQLLQPMIKEVRAKFKDDQQRQQMETMKLYREYGLNPMGGCLPMVLQLPILYSLWNTLSSAIDLRQSGFALWIRDLSVPDYIIHLPLAVPLLGDKLSALALIMGTTLFLQQRMMITDPQQKMLIYLMPVLLTLAFNNLPSGLNLYYLTFNVLAIGQQVYMTKLSKNPMTLEQLRATAKNKKKGWLSQKMEAAQQMAEMQKQQGGAARNGERKVDGRSPVEPRKKK